MMVPRSRLASFRGCEDALWPELQKGAPVIVEGKDSRGVRVPPCRDAIGDQMVGTVLIVGGFDVGSLWRSKARPENQQGDKKIYRILGVVHGKLFYPVNE